MGNDCIITFQLKKSILNYYCWSQFWLKKKLSTIKRQIALMFKNLDAVEYNCLGK